MVCRVSHAFYFVCFMLIFVSVSFPVLPVSRVFDRKQGRKQLRVIEITIHLESMYTIVIVLKARKEPGHNMKQAGHLLLHAHLRLETENKKLPACILDRPSSTLRWW